MAVVFFGDISVRVPFFPHTDGVAFFVVVFLESFVPVVVESFPIPYGVVVLVVALGLEFFIVVEGFPCTIFFAFLVVPCSNYIAVVCPFLEFTMRNVVLEGYFKFLDSIGVPFNLLCDFAIWENPDGRLFEVVYMVADDLFLRFFHGATCKNGKNGKKNDVFGHSHAQ